MEIKDNLKYTKDHEWVMLDGKVATVGITDFRRYLVLIMTINLVAHKSFV